MAKAVLLTKPKGSTTYGTHFMGQGIFSLGECKKRGKSMMERGQAEGYALIEVGTGRLVDYKNITESDIKEIESKAVAQ